MKANKKLLTVSLIITMLPCLVGLLLWNRLPDRIPIQFTYNNEVSNYGSKVFVVFGMPVLLAALQFLCVFMSYYDPRRPELNRKIFPIILSIIPAVSMLVCILSYGTALGYPINPGMVTNLLMGAIFIAIGNYMPKVTQNYTVGIKIPWTLNSQENWNRTHRLAGWLFIGGGLLVIVNAVFTNRLLFFAALALMVGIPFIYSFMLYKRGI